MRCDVVAEGREGWVEEVKCDWKLKWDVVGSVNGNGMVKISQSMSIDTVNRGFWYW